MRFSGLGKFYSILYDDRMDIYRTSQTLNDDSTTSMHYDEAPLYTDVACRLSFSSYDSASDSEVDRNPVRFNPQIFCDSQVDLKAGDYVVIRRFSDNGTVMMTYEGPVTTPSVYSTHLEAHVRIDEGA